MAHRLTNTHFIGNIIPIMPYTNLTQILLFPCRWNVNFFLIRTLNRQKWDYSPSTLDRPLYNWQVKQVIPLILLRQTIDEFGIFSRIHDYTMLSCASLRALFFFVVEPYIKRTGIDATVLIALFSEPSPLQASQPFSERWFGPIFVLCKLNESWWNWVW